MIKTDSYALANEATLRSTDPLAGVDWCWATTTNHVATNLPQVLFYHSAELRSKRITRGLELLFSQYDELLKRLAD